MNVNTTNLDLPDCICTFVHRLNITYTPDLVVLFGSYVNGNVTMKSDVDLLIVLSTVVDADELARRRTQLTVRLFPRIDLVISSRKELEHARGQRAAFLRSVLEHGRILVGSKPNSLQHWLEVLSHD